MLTILYMLLWLLSSTTAKPLTPTQNPCSLTSDPVCAQTGDHPSAQACFNLLNHLPRFNPRVSQPNTWAGRGQDIARSRGCGLRIGPSQNTRPFVFNQFRQIDAIERIIFECIEEGSGVGGFTMIGPDESILVFLGYLPPPRLPGDGMDGGVEEQGTNGTDYVDAVLGQLTACPRRGQKAAHLATNLVE